MKPSKAKIFDGVNNFSYLITCSQLKRFIIDFSIKNHFSTGTGPNKCQIQKLVWIATLPNSNKVKH